MMRFIVLATVVFAAVTQTHAQPSLPLLFKEVADRQWLKNAPLWPERDLAGIERQIIRDYERDLKGHTNADLMSVAVAYGNLGNVDKAIDVLRQLLETKPADIEGLRLLGKVFVGVGRPEEA